MYTNNADLSTHGGRQTLRKVRHFYAEIQLISKPTVHRSNAIFTPAKRSGDGSVTKDEPFF